MKKLAFVLPLAFLVMAFKQDKVNDKPLREIENNAFQEGEYLKYRIHYGLINAGEAELMVEDISYKNNRPAYHFVGKGRSKGMAEWFFKTRDRYDSWVDTRAMIPWEFNRDVNEGGFIINRNLVFDHYENVVQIEDRKSRQNKTATIPENTQDLLSAFYYARTFDTQKLKKGDELPIGMFLDYEVYNFRLKYMGTEMMKSEWGKVRCKKFIPTVQEGRVFSEKEGITLWVTDDENKIHIRVEAELAVGSIKMDLTEYRGNKHPIAFQK